MVVGAIDLDLGPVEARLGTGGRRTTRARWARSSATGPPTCGRPRSCPVSCSAQLEPGGRPSSAAVRWPAAFAGIIAGWMLARRMCTALGIRAGVLFGVCWFGSLALIDRSAASGLDLILGLATLAAIDRLMTRGSDLVAGLWASLAFLAGGWPPLVVIGLAIIVIGKNHGAFLRAPAPAATRDGDRLVVLDLLVGLRRGLGGRAHTAPDPEAGLVSRLWVYWPSGCPGARSPFSLAPLGARGLETRRPAVVDRLVSSRHSPA